MRRMLIAACACLAGAGGWSLAWGQQPAQAPGTVGPDGVRDVVAPQVAQRPRPPAAESEGYQPKGAVPPRAADAAAVRRKMDTLLAEWERRSGEIKTLDAGFLRIDHTVEWGDTTFVGRAILKAPDLAFLDFVKVDPKTGQKKPDQQIRCTGQEVYQYFNKTNQIFIYPLARQERQRALEEGPLPFLFNMRAADAKKRYDMTLAGETVDEYIIRIHPKEQIDRDAFILADVILSKSRFMPLAIKLWAPNLKDYQLYRFDKPNTGIRLNVAVNEKNFQGLMLKGWQVVRNPAPEAGPEGSGVRGSMPPQARRPVPKRAGQGDPRR